jgi:predicted SAM-dependent methyltransferase
MKLNIGCGPKIKNGYTNLDMSPLPGVDVVHNLDVYPWPFENETADQILAEHVFEHVKQPVEFVLECWRILKPRGELVIVCPHWTSENAFTDPTHVRFVTDKTFDYWCENTDLNKSLGAPFLGDVYNFHKHKIRRIGGDIIYRMRKNGLQNL